MEKKIFENTPKTQCLPIFHWIWKKIKSTYLLPSKCKLDRFLIDKDVFYYFFIIISKVHSFTIKHIFLNIFFDFCFFFSNNLVHSLFLISIFFHFYWITHLSFAVMSTFSKSRSILSSSSMLFKIKEKLRLFWGFFCCCCCCLGVIKTYACSWLCKCCTSSFLLSTICTNSASSNASRSRCACDFLQSSTDNAARSSRFKRAYFVSKSFSCSLLN